MYSIKLCSGIRKDEQGIPQDEENFEEAIAAANLCIHETGIPSHVKQILNDSCCINITHEVNVILLSKFWVSF